MAHILGAAQIDTRAEESKIENQVDTVPRRIGDGVNLAADIAKGFGASGTLNRKREDRLKVRLRQIHPIFNFRVDGAAVRALPRNAEERSSQHTGDFMAARVIP